jgi:hypothetical protein
MGAAGKVDCVYHPVCVCGIARRWRVIGQQEGYLGTDDIVSVDVELGQGLRRIEDD